MFQKFPSAILTYKECPVYTAKHDLRSNKMFISKEKQFTMDGNFHI